MSGPAEAATPEGEAQHASGLETRDRLLVLAAPALLVAVAALGIVRYHSEDLSPWRGASFGMFASYEQVPSRFLHVEVIDDDGRRRIAVPAGLDHLAERAAAHPGGPALADLARRIGDRLEADQVTAEVRGHTVDAGDGTLAIGIRIVARVVVDR